jgi:hypothetical protein
VKKYCYALVAILSMIALAMAPAGAMLTFSGVEFRADAAPGYHLSHNITVNLSSDEPSAYNFLVEALDWYQNPSGSNIGVKENPDIAPYSAKNLLFISPQNFTLKPGTSQDIKIEGKMPEGDGGRYAVIFVYTSPKAGNGGQGIGVSVGANTLVILTISGSKQIKTGEIENLSLLEPIMAKQQNISIKFKNTGNYLYKVHVISSLKDEKGNILATDSSDIRGSIIPTATRQIKFSLIPKSELKPGTYAVGINVTLEDGTILDSKETKFELKN